MKEFDIAKFRKIWFGVAIVCMLIAVGSLIIQGLNFGIDFVGGTIITIDMKTEFDTTETRTITDKYDKYADITYGGDDKTWIIISSQKSFSEEEKKKLFSEFQDAYNLPDSSLISVDTVSPTVGNEITKQAIIAVIVAILLMLIYIWFRFEIFFGLAAIAALIFDLVNLVGFYSLFQIQVNTPFIAAILTILGYSINDTIVVFDRIRENKKQGLYHNDLEKLVSVSISQTLKRSIYTVLTTLIAILALYLFGVTEIKNFSLPLIVGIVSGCYSSIFVASPIWLVLQNRFPNVTDKKKKKTSKKQKKDDKVLV